MEHLNITIPSEALQLIRSEIALGHYGSDSEVIQAALASFRPSPMADWLPSKGTMRDLIAEASSDPSECFSAAEMDVYFEQKFADAAAKPAHNG